MIPATTFAQILANRGRIVLVTQAASVALPFEQAVLRLHGTLISTRGVEDPYLWITLWTRLVSEGGFGMLSVDASRFASGRPIMPSTDTVWVGDTGHPRMLPHLWLVFSHCMTRAGDNARQWLISEGGAAVPASSTNGSEGEL